MKENTLTFSTGNYIMFLDISGGVWHRTLSSYLCLNIAVFSEFSARGKFFFYAFCKGS